MPLHACSVAREVTLSRQASPIAPERGHTASSRGTVVGALRYRRSAGSTGRTGIKMQDVDAAHSDPRFAVDTHSMIDTLRYQSSVMDVPRAAFAFILASPFRCRTA